MSMFPPFLFQSQSSWKSALLSQTSNSSASVTRTYRPTVSCSMQSAGWVESKVSRNGPLISTPSHSTIAIFIYIPFPTLFVLIPILTKFSWKKMKNGNVRCRLYSGASHCQGRRAFDYNGSQ